MVYGFHWVSNISSGPFQGMGIKGCPIQFVNSENSGSDCYDNIGGGAGNAACADAHMSFIGGGCSNVLGGNVTCIDSMNFIGAGQQNQIGVTNTCNVIGGGCKNQINDLSPMGVIGGGTRNNIGTSGVTATCFGVIGGGQHNQVCEGTDFASIFSGSNIKVNGNNSFIGAGQTNTIDSAFGLVSCSSIGGGINNKISDNGAAPAVYSVIVGGGGDAGNLVFEQYGFIGGGKDNCVAGQKSGIVGGELNTINRNSDLSFIGGGGDNSIGSLTGRACWGVIFGGSNNCIDAGPGVATLYDIIGGGLSNKICAGTCHASIFSGISNTVSGNCSAILGGDTNSDGGQPFMGMFGSGLTAATVPGPGAFWANELVIPNIPINATGPPIGPPVGYPLGSLYYICVGPGLCEVAVA